MGYFDGDQLWVNEQPLMRAFRYAQDCACVSPDHVRVRNSVCFVARAPLVAKPANAPFTGLISRGALPLATLGSVIDHGSRPARGGPHDRIAAAKLTSLVKAKPGGSLASAIGLLVHRAEHRVRLQVRRLPAL